MADSGHGWLAPHLIGRMRPPRRHQERGGKERGGREGGEARCTGTDCSRTEADQYLVDSRSFHPCDHGKRNLAPSVTTTRISLPLNGLRSTQCGHYRQVAVTAAILVEIKSPLEWVQRIWDWLFIAERLVICVRRRVPFFIRQPILAVALSLKFGKALPRLCFKVSCPSFSEHVLLVPLGNWLWLSVTCFYFCRIFLLLLATVPVES